MAHWALWVNHFANNIHNALCIYLRLHEENDMEFDEPCLKCRNPIKIIANVVFICVLFARAAIYFKLNSYRTVIISNTY